MTNIRPATGRSQSETQETLDRLLAKIQSAANQQVGYPANQNFDYSPLLPFLKYSLKQRRRPLPRQQLLEQHPRESNGRSSPASPA